jgi:O-antigen ligase
VALKPGWPIVAVIVGFPLWWVLGLSQFVWQLAAIPMMVTLVRSRYLRVPTGFGVWLLFLAWVVISATTLDGSTERFVSYGYRALGWFTATVWFVYVYNLRSGTFTLRRATRLFFAFWVMVVIGGFAGLLVGDREFSTIAERVVPQFVLSNELGADLFKLHFAQTQDFLGFPVPRPAAPFIFTNEWAAALVYLSPFVPLMWRRVGRFGASLMPTVTGLALVPIVISLNRGLWLSIVVAAVYVAARRTWAGDPRVLLTTVVMIVLVGVAVVVTPLNSFVAGRASSDHSNEARASLYAAVIEDVADSPLLGYGAPLSNERNPLRPAVGTHGQFWSVLFSYGIPGAVLFTWFMGRMAWRTGRGDLSGDRLWLHLVPVMVLVAMWFYQIEAAQLHVIFVALALALRERVADSE